MHLAADDDATEAMVPSRPDDEQHQHPQQVDAATQTPASSSSPALQAPAPATLLLALEDVLPAVVSFLRPREVARLSSTAKDVARLALHTHVQSISGKFRSSDRLIRHLPLCSRLRVLNLKGNKLTSEAIRLLGSFLRSSSSAANFLEVLDLSALSLTAKGVALLAQSLVAAGAATANTSTTTDSSSTSTSSASKQPKRALPLKTLGLAVNNVGDDGAAALGDLWASGACANLESINLSNTVIGPRGLQQLARGLAHCQRLTSLNLSNNPLDAQHPPLEGVGAGAGAGTNAADAAVAIGAQAWGDFARSLAPTLQHLCIFNSVLSASAVRQLCAKWHLPALQHLNMAWNRIGSDGARVLARSLASGACPALRTLNLSRCHIHKDSLPDLTLALSAPKGVGHSLCHLNLGWNPLNASDVLPQAGVAPLRALARAIAQCPDLECLVLSNVELGTEGALALADGFLDAAAARPAAVCCPALNSINLSWNGIGRDGGAAIARLFSSPTEGAGPRRFVRCCPRLVSLDISYNCIGPSDGARAMWNAWAMPEGSPTPLSPYLPSGLVVYIIGNQIPRCNSHYVKARDLGRLLDDITVSRPAATNAPGIMGAAAAAAAVAAFSAAAAAAGAAGAANSDSTTTVPPPPSQPQTPILPLMSPLPHTPERRQTRLSTPAAVGTASRRGGAASGRGATAAGQRRGGRTRRGGGGASSSSSSSYLGGAHAVPPPSLAAQMHFSSAVSSSTQHYIATRDNRRRRRVVGRR